MKLREIIKTNPALQYVTDNMELMSSAGRRVLLDSEFLTDATALMVEWESTARAIRATADEGARRAYIDMRHCLMQLHDLQGTLASLAMRTPLNEVELFEIKNLADLCRQARTALATLELSDTLPLPDLSEVFQLLDPDHTGLTHFYIYDSYDPRLPGLRRELKALQTSGGDPSRIAALVAEQNDIQQQVCLRLTDSLHAHHQALAEAMELMAYADVLLARAELALRWGLTRPVLGDHIAYRGLFNPRLREHNRAEGLRYQPVDIEVEAGVCLITGANMAGKTVLLKSVGTAQQMVQLGMYAPADEAVVTLVDDVATSIGDEQDEMNGLSSFASEIIKISNIIQRCRRERLLVLVDEPARTTNPVEGKALVQALTALLGETGSFSLVTTHYSQLGAGCRRLRVKGFVENMCDLPLNPQTINRFIDYSLTPDTSDEVPQEALRIASILGCDEALLERARQALG